MLSKRIAIGPGIVGKIVDGSLILITVIAMQSENKAELMMKCESEIMGMKH